MSNEETTGFDPKAVADVFGGEPETVEVSLVPATAEKPEEKPKATEPVSARIAAAKRAEAKAAQQRTAASAKEQELQQRETAITARAREQEERENLLKLMEEDPAAYFEKKKAGPQAIRAHLERLANGLKPEEVSEKRQTAIETEMERLKAEIAKRDEDSRAQKLAQERQKAETQAQEAFTAEVEGNLEKYPHLVEEFHTPEAAIQAAYAVLEEVLGTDAQGRKITRVAAFVAKEGRHPNNDEIAEYLNSVAQKRIEARQNNAWKKRLDDGGGQPSGQVSRSPTVTGKPRTLSARDTSSRATTPSDKWTQEWADEESLRILRSGT